MVLVQAELIWLAWQICALQSHGLFNTRVVKAMMNKSNISYQENLNRLV